MDVARVVLRTSGLHIPIIHSVLVSQTKSGEERGNTDSPPGLQHHHPAHHHVPCRTYRDQHRRLLERPGLRQA